MILYLDTHVAVWLCQAAVEKISAAAKKHIEHSNLRISPIVVLELQYLHERERIVMPPDEVIFKLQSRLGAVVCDFPFPAIITVAMGEKWTRDPFDRIIVANAKANGNAALASSDEVIRANYLKTVW